MIPILILAAWYTVGLIIVGRCTYTVDKATGHDVIQCRISHLASRLDISVRLVEYSVIAGIFTSALVWPLFLHIMRKPASAE